MGGSLDGHSHAGSEQAGELFEPAEDKIYRHPTFTTFPMW